MLHSPTVVQHDKFMYLKKAVAKPLADPLRE